MSISVSIVEDEARVRHQLTALINEATGFACKGSYGSAEEALREIPRQPPDVVLMDINLGHMSGVECTFRLKRLVPEVQIVMLTVYNDSDQIFKALEMGASGYLLKHTPPDEILKAVKEVHHGGAPMSGYIARQVVQSFARRTDPGSPDLTPREAESAPRVARAELMSIDTSASV